MGTATLLPWWSRPGDGKPLGDIEDEIREELEFHLSEIADELKRQGMSHDEANRASMERFGDLDAYVKKCQRIKTGDRVVLQRILLATSVMLALLVGLLTWRVFSLTSTQQDVVARLDQALNELQSLREQNQSPSTRPASILSNVSGDVHDRDGNPIVGARVLGIYKTWPGGHYQQQATHAHTDSAGAFVLPDQLNTIDNHALQIAFVAKDYAIESIYVMDPGFENGRVEPFNIVLDNAAPVRVRLVDKSGHGVAFATVFPSARRAASGDDYNVYFQGSEAIHVKTNEHGYVSLPYFAVGDRATIAVKRPNEEWEELEFDVVDDELPYELRLTNPRSGDPAPLSAAD